LSPARRLSDSAACFKRDLRRLDDVGVERAEFFHCLDMRLRQFNRGEFFFLKAVERLFNREVGEVCHFNLRILNFSTYGHGDTIPSPMMQIMPHDTIVIGLRITVKPVDRFCKGVITRRQKDPNAITTMPSPCIRVVMILIASSIFLYGCLRASFDYSFDHLRHDEISGCCFRRVSQNLVRAIAIGQRRRCGA
jgi:hypothetical protein